jgi:predicted nucleotidyltransferase
MAQAAWQVVDGRIRYAGRTLAEWVPDVVADLVAAAQPLRVLLFGSVARAVDGPDSDIDLLVVLPHVEPSRRHGLTVKLARAINAPAPVDLLVTDRPKSPSAGIFPGFSGWHCARAGWCMNERAERLRREVWRWLRLAHEDLAAAAHLADAAHLPHRVACLMAQPDERAAGT